MNPSIEFKSSAISPRAKATEASSVTGAKTQLRDLIPGSVEVSVDSFS